MLFGIKYLWTTGQVEKSLIFSRKWKESTALGDGRQADGLCVRTGLAGWGLVGLWRGHCSFLNLTFLYLRWTWKAYAKTQPLWGARMGVTLVRGRGWRDVSGHWVPGMLPWFPLLSWAWLTQSCSLWELSPGFIYHMISVLFWLYIGIVHCQSSFKWLLCHKILGGAVFENILKYGVVHSNFRYQPLQKFVSCLLSNLPSLFLSPSPLPCISEQL